MRSALIIDDDELFGAGEGIPPEAAKWKRAINFVVDYFVRLGVYTLIVATIVQASMAAGFPEIGERLDGPTARFTYMYSLWYALTVGLYFVAEHYLHGRTLGKLLTGTRARRLDGGRPTASTVLLRSLWRIVPLEPLTFFADGRGGWHDERTDTYVADERAKRVRKVL